MNTFLALWNRMGEPVDREVIRPMLDFKFNPQCDGQELWLQQEVALANQYFWITPEEQGQPQPRIDQETGCVITCSARLDNRPELLHALGLTDAGANSLSDADLILRSYSRWGTECPRFLLGDFAFAIWDPIQRCFFAVRDALGAQELYYWLDPRFLIMANRIAILLMHPAIQPKLNETKIAEYLAVDWGDDVNTFYDSIYHLPPAHCLLVTAESCRLWRYWDIEPGKTIRYARPQEYAEHYQALMKESLRCRLRSAYPPGISLSGGLDSSSLACLAADVLAGTGLPEGHLASYSYVFDRLGSCDERAYIQAVVEQASHTYPIHSVMVAGDTLWPAPLNEDWLIQRDYPLQDAYYYLLRAILKAAQAGGARLMLSGFYGDDLYAGSEYWLADLMLEMRFRQAAKIWRNSYRPIDLKYDLLQYGLRGMVPTKIKRWYRFLRPSTPGWTEWLDPRLADRTGLKGLGATLTITPKFRLPGLQNRYSALFFNGYPETVTYLQDIAQQNGMEYRFPFLDRRIVEFVLALPAEQIALPGLSRRILRAALAGKLPELVQQRPGKTGLFELYDQGIYENGFSEIQHGLSHAQVLERGYIRPDWLAAELDGSTHTQAGFILWLVLSLENWLQKYW